MNKKGALIAMSGGVDSSVAASLMTEKGYNCIGITMKLFDNEGIGLDTESTCCSADDIEDARSVCNNIGIPYYVVNFTDAFREKVIDKFVCSYEQGKTPNPCIECNRCLKFKHLFNKMKELELDYIVTGHYARVEFDEAKNRYLLKKAVDETKDQSYVLYSLTQEQLSHIQFPLGELTKSDARKVAEKIGLINADKPDSQDICFVKDGKYADFIKFYRGKEPEKGNFVDINGNVLGEHKGIIYYTVGQRKGLGLALNEPMYVKEIDTINNSVILARDCELFTKELEADEINLITVDEIKEPMRVKAKVRYRHKEQWATVTQIGKDRLKVVFDEPQRAITKGQALVMYDGDYVVGGGTICMV